MGLFGAALVVVSAEALPMAFYWVWAATGVGWLVASGSGRPKAIVSMGWLTLAMSLAAMVMAAAFQRLVPVAAGNSRVYVVGDSISAGLDSRGNVPWPTLLRQTHGMDVVDLSRAGCSIGEATDRLKKAQIENAVVVVEIGGNDLLNHLAPDIFDRELDTLIGQLQGASTRVAMFELPLFPFDNAYGVAQRRVAGKYHVPLVPRRYFAGILATPGDTVDGIHLSAQGQRAMADLVCRVLGRR